VDATKKTYRRQGWVGIAQCQFVHRKALVLDIDLAQYVNLQMRMSEFNDAFEFF
jgi:hypothetical protein